MRTREGGTLRVFAYSVELLCVVQMVDAYVSHAATGRAAAAAAARRPTATTETENEMVLSGLR